MRPELAEARRVWIEQRQPDLANMLERLVFIDEIEPLEAPLVQAQWRGLKTNLVKATGWARVGKRLIDHAPFGHWMAA